MELLRKGICTRMVKFKVKHENVYDNGFSSLKCSVCQSYNYYTWLGCCKLFYSKNRDKIPIRAQVKNNHPELLVQNNFVDMGQNSEGIHRSP